MADVVEKTGVSLAPGGVRPSLLRRVRFVASGVAAALLGLLPHILHHAGPLAGAALFAGVGGSLLFGVIGLVAAIPFLVRMKRPVRQLAPPFGDLGPLWRRVPPLALVVGPALTGDDSDGAQPSATPAERPAASRAHEQHH